MTEESAFNNPIYDTGVSTDVMHMNLQDVDSKNTIVQSWSISLPSAWLSSHIVPAEGTISHPSYQSSELSLSIYGLVMNTDKHYCQQILALEVYYLALNFGSSTVYLALNL